MFRRRRREESPATKAEVEEAAQAPTRKSGPWDSKEPYPERERADFGGMLLPVGADLTTRPLRQGSVVFGVGVQHGESSLQVLAFAAPKKSTLWDEVRAELVEKLKKSGSTVEEREGPFGIEVLATTLTEGREQPVRHIGVDRPRWLLRAIIEGPAAQDADSAAPLEGFIQDVVVVRGDEPMAPKELIELREPLEPKQLEEQQDDRKAGPGLDPFGRGPEIAETR